jgi:hypothetical protein
MLRLLGMKPLGTQLSSTKGWIARPGGPKACQSRLKTQEVGRVVEPPCYHQRFFGLYLCFA